VLLLLLLLVLLLLSLSSSLSLLSYSAAAVFDQLLQKSSGNQFHFLSRTFDGC
jgi:hypothetical protein